MSDRFHASMVIGGDLKNSDVQEFLTAFQSQGVYNNDESKNSCDATVHTDLTPFMNEDMCLQVHDNEAAGGELAELQAVCIRLGLSYDHHNDAYYDCDASNEFVRKGKELGYIFSSQTGQNLISTDALKRLFGDDLTGIDYVDSATLRRTIMELGRLDVARVPEFRIVEL